MAIQNASDLLVYAKTASAAKQITRIRVLTTNPITLPGGSSNGTVKINNVTNNSGVVYDNEETQVANNTGTGVLFKIRLELEDNDYTDISGVDGIDGDYTYRDFENGANGIVPTLEIIDGTATLNNNAVVIEILTRGSDALLDPVAFSTQASFSTNMDLRDVTTKDSEGWSESVGGLKSFEVSTELLQTLNPDHPIDGTDFINKLKERSLVNVSFSDRIRNLLTTNLTTAGQDNFSITGNITQTTNQSDPFGGTTASKIAVNGVQTNQFIRYAIKTARITDKKINWSFYVKGSGSTTEASIYLNSASITTNSIVTKLEGDGSFTIVSSTMWKISGLSTSEWTRVSVSSPVIDVSTADTYFYIYPGLFSAQSSDEILTSSWQIEQVGSATDYQDPTTVTRWEGEALVTSVSFDAGVEDNLTCSATFTGTSTNTLNT